MINREAMIIDIWYYTHVHTRQIFSEIFYENSSSRNSGIL